LKAAEPTRCPDTSDQHRSAGSAGGPISSIAGAQVVNRVCRS